MNLDTLKILSKFDLTISQLDISKSNNNDNKSTKIS